MGPFEFHRLFTKKSILEHFPKNNFLKLGTGTPKSPLSRVVSVSIDRYEGFNRFIGHSLKISILGQFPKTKSLKLCTAKSALSSVVGLI